MQIEKNVIINNVNRGKWPAMVRKMEIGDSVEVESRDDATRLLMAFKMAIKGKGLSRLQENGKIRVWRIA